MAAEKDSGKMESGRMEIAESGNEKMQKLCHPGQKRLVIKRADQLHF